MIERTAQAPVLIHKLQTRLRGGLKLAGRIFAPVLRVQRVVGLVALHAPLVGGLVPLIGSELLRHFLGDFDKHVCLIPIEKLFQVDGCHM